MEEMQDLYKVTRGQIEHLDNTISQRIIWLVLSQSFFVSGYAILLTGNPNDPHFGDVQHILTLLFPIISMVLIMFSAFDIACGAVYIRRLAAYFEQEAKKKDMPAYPPVNGFKMLNFFKNLSALTVPIIFIIFWIYIITR